MLLLQFLLLQIASCIGGYVHVSMRASFPAPPFELEVIEAISSMKPNLVFQLLDGVKLPEGASDLDIYTELTELSRGKKLLDDIQLGMLNLSLSTRQFAPAVQAHFHYYQETILPNFESSSVEGVDVWADIGGQAETSVDELKRRVDSLTAEHKATQKLLPFDRIYQPKVPKAKKVKAGEDNQVPVTILYASSLSAKSMQFHRALKKLADEKAIAYVVRWKPRKSSEKLIISGYGVELALKSTEYKVSDDQKIDDELVETMKSDSVFMGYDLNKLRRDYPNRTDAIDKFKADLEELTPQLQLGQLEENKIRDLGFRAASYVLSSPFPMSTLRVITQDFPKYATFLSKFSVNREVQLEIAYNHRIGVKPGENKLYINGLVIEENRMDLYGILSAVRKELDATKHLEAIGLMPQEIVEIIVKSTNSNEHSDDSGEEPDTEVYDTREEWEKPGRRYKGEKISGTVWLNDLERDSRYSGWPSELIDILRSQFGGGSLPRLRKNLFNVVLAADLSKPLGIKVIADAMKMVKASVPIRFAIMPVLDYAETADISPSERITRMFYHLLNNFGKKAVAELFDTLADKLKSDVTILDNPVVLKDVFNVIIKDKSAKGDQIVFEQLHAKEANVEEFIEKAREMTRRFGLAQSRNCGAMFVNGFFFEIDEAYEHVMSTIIQQQLYHLQKMVYMRMLTDGIDIYNFFIQKAQAKTRRNPWITTSDANPLRVTSILSQLGFDKLKSIEYATKSAERASGQTVWILGDFGQKQAVNFLCHSIAFMNSSSLGDNARFAYVHNKEETLDYENIKSNLKKCFETYYPDKDLELLGSLDLNKVASLVKYDAEIVDKFGTSQSVEIYANGRHIGPFPKTYTFRTMDYEILVDVEMKRSERIVQTLNSLFKFTKTTNEISDAILAAVSIVAHLDTLHAGSSYLEHGTKADSIQRNRKLLSFKNKASSFQVGSSDGFVSLTAVVDPTSEGAQKLSYILEELASVPGISVQVFMNPKTSVDKLVNRFYRYSFNRLAFDTKGKLVDAFLRFEDIPVEPLLTLGTDVAQSWVVMPVVSPHDLDNIRLSETSRQGIEAELELKYVLIEGHATDIKLQTAPRGLEFAAGTPKEPAKSDTIVMANLGYYQLKANIGVWNMRTREGRSREFYELKSVDDGQHVQYVKDDQVEVIVNTFEGVTLITRVMKKPGFEDKDILSPESLGGGIVDNVLGWFSGLKKDTDEADINVFSVASGHLYERFLRIMIQSVLKQTKHSVKFWFIENFLSPSFKDFIPVFAKKHGFKYELVTYKWPRWLRNQKEKQRTIWGYKILFLDVLFPLSLKKVIFVDADQIVRADLKELVDMDLKGAPYGYTPFCDDRPEIEGFRFWKKGYWNDHLKGRPYHISALYVVDLVRFRQLAAGDRLRQHYQMVSADPNSLANLDQDLPNDMQHQVEIFSLPQEWLWCETWCSDASLKSAKTIDLCNNPMTKEPKLERARRLLPEWSVFDQQQRNEWEEWKIGRAKHDEL